jgi:hypothetical protein
MQEETYTLQTMLDAIIKTKNNKAKKRLIYDQSLLNGIGSKWVIAFFISLPILLYIGIFNPKIFGMLGIAQAIIFFIVFLSMIMIMIVGLSFINNNKVIRQITPSWNKLFPTVDLAQLLSSGATPYKDFLTYYTQSLNEGLEGEILETRLKENFLKMQEDNKELFEAINRGRNR